MITINVLIQNGPLRSFHTRSVTPIVPSLVDDEQSSSYSRPATPISPDLQLLGREQDINNPEYQSQTKYYGSNSRSSTKHDKREKPISRGEVLCFFYCGNVTNVPFLFLFFKNGSGLGIHERVGCRRGGIVFFYYGNDTNVYFIFLFFRNGSELGIHERVGCRGGILFFLIVGMSLTSLFFIFR